MTDFIDPPGEQPPVPAAPAGGPTAADIKEGSVFAILSYVFNFISLPFFLVPLLMRNNAFSLYHAKQCLMFWIVSIVSAVIAMVTAFILVITVVLACLAPVLYLVLIVFLLVINVIGLINACKGQCRPLPVIGTLAERWFAGITLQAPPPSAGGGQ